MKSFRPKHQSRPKKSTLVIGTKAVLHALASGIGLERIYIRSNTHGADVDLILTESKNAQVPVNKVPVEKLNSFNAGNHDGCIGILSKIQYQQLQDVISFVVDKGEVPLFLLLDGITDVRNIGGIARTAYSCGVHAIIIPDKGVGALNEDAILTSAGALEQLTVCRVNSLMKAVDELHLNGIQVYASEMKAPKKIAEVDFKEPVAIVMGSEDKGIYSALQKICDESISIPMPGGFESLNVSVATGMILYEAVRQRINRG